MLIGAFVMLPGDQDLFMVKAVLARGNSNTRVKLQRWSDGNNRTALLRDVIKISPDGARELIWKRLATANRRFALLHAEEIFYGLGLHEEIQLFISNLIKDHAIAPAGREFIIELIIQLSWQQTYSEPFVTNHYVYKKICAYCLMFGLDFPTQTLVRRRLWKLSKQESRISSFPDEAREG
ncbi:hypothetical protein ACK56M_13885 [Pseudomonas sp. s4]|uniref:hypothetical protein n=1 Tax=Pseudomonas sp. s4 TaxID=353218 RepID=UPI00398D3E4F